MSDDRLEDIRRNNVLLTRTGPGTPGGDLLRRYWQPVALVRDLSPEGDPVPIRILGEDLVLFRDDRGRVGLLGIKCAHRCADLSYGRVEDGGLRCIYHGWLYDVSGRCLEQPAEIDGGRARDEVRQKAYPTREAGGAIFAYLGPGAPPEFPNYPAIVAPEPYRLVGRWHIDCNYLQGNEGNIDPVHTSYLHRYDKSAAETGAARSSQELFQADVAPKLGIESTRFGLRIYAERKSPDPAKKILRVTNFLMPNSSAIMGGEGALGRGGFSVHWHVPIDDTSHWRFEFRFHAKRPLDRETARRSEMEKLPGDYPRRNRDNRYLQDRKSMREGSYLGMGRVFPVHDVFVTESQGRIHEHADEHLAASDIAIVRARRQMLEAIAEIEAGRDPVGVVRKEADNDFRDLLVLSEEVGANIDPKMFCKELESENIYALDPRVKEVAGA
jgi:phthalate 4,5-dioxygenase oxygenase subunit